MDVLRARLHDAEFSAQEIEYDQEARHVRLPFAQEPWPGLGGPAAERVRRRWWGEEMSVPFLRGTLTVAAAQSVEWPAAFGREGTGALTGVIWDERQHKVVLWDDAGERLLISVDELDVIAELTDEVVRTRRRRVSRLLRFESTSG